jgi:hypothetical protein
MAYRRTAILFFRGLCLWCLWLASPSFPWLISRGDYFSTVPADPFVRPLVPSCSLIGYQPDQVYHHHHFSELLCFWRLFFCLGEGADTSIMSGHSLSATWWESQPLASWPPTREFVRGPRVMSSCFPHVDPASDLGSLCRCWISAASVVSSQTFVLWSSSYIIFLGPLFPSYFLYRRSFTTASLKPCRNGTADHPSADGGQLLPEPTIALVPFLQL